MSRRRKCFFACEGHVVTFKFPSDDSSRAKWSDFVYGDNPSPRNAFVCARHFTDDCFVNKDLFDSGRISRLCLKPGAIPTIKYAASPEPSTSTSDDCILLQAKRTVGTQLSARTLQSYRSIGIQVTGRTTSRGKDIQLSTSPAQTFEQRPAKRPRMEMEEEEDISIPLPHFTYHPADSDAPELTIKVQPDDFEDTKYIVFESCLRGIFETCPVCNRHCDVERRRCGTFVSFSQVCPHCSYSRKWQSQPLKGTTPLGNLQLSLAIYLSGGSFAKVSRMFKDMNLQVHKYDTFRSHARTYIEPSIYLKWKVDQEKLLEKVKTKGKVALAGDMSGDSPGHSAKAASYTVMELEDKKILDIHLVQSNNGSSSHMRKDGLKRCLELLESKSVEVDYIVTDRHPQVQKYLQQKAMTQYYDVSHVVKGVSKKLEFLAKKKGFTMVKKWLPAIKKHMYWTAASSKTGPEKIAKWSSLVNHSQDVHSHEDLLFPKCPHPDRVSRDPTKWLQPGTKALYKVNKMLLNKRILKDVAKLSFGQQTSELEVFHSSIQHFAPRSVSFTFNEMLCRLYIAAMHHNENVLREQSIARMPSFRMTFSKTMKGQTTIKPIKTPATYEYQNELMRLVCTKVWNNPTPFIEELQKVNAPEDLCEV